MNIPFLTRNKKTIFAVTLANDQILYSNSLEYTEKGIMMGRTLTSYTFVPYDAILRVDYNENYTK